MGTNWRQVLPLDRDQRKGQFMLKHFSQGEADMLLSIEPNSLGIDDHSNFFFQIKRKIRVMDLLISF
jgi:hypothetical protein